MTNWTAKIVYVQGGILPTMLKKIVCWSTKRIEKVVSTKCSTWSIQHYVQNNSRCTNGGINAANAANQCIIWDGNVILLIHHVCFLNLNGMTIIWSDFAINEWLGLFTVVIFSNQNFNLLQLQYAIRPKAQYNNCYRLEVSCSLIQIAILNMIK